MSSKDFAASMRVFENNAIDRFTDLITSFYSEQINVYVEHRVEKSSGTLCVIYFYQNRAGYDIYKLAETIYR